MTNTEAIEVLQFNTEFVDAEFEDALILAISALKKQESKKPLKMKNCKLRSPYSCPECYAAIPGYLL